MAEDLHRNIAWYGEASHRQQLQAQPALQRLRLKKLDVDYPCSGSIHAFHPNVDVVHWWDFIKVEPDRVPLLIVNRAGLWPKSINYHAFFKEERLVALLHCTYLSSISKSIGLYRLPANWNYNEPLGEVYFPYKIR